jgi:hypothetical protein
LLVIRIIGYNDIDNDVNSSKYGKFLAPSLILSSLLTRHPWEVPEISFMENTQSSPAVREVLPAAFILATGGWIGLFWLIDATRPTIGPRWLFFFLSVMAISGTVLPFVAYVNNRITTKPAAQMSTIVRQSLWVSLFLSALIWLQMAHILNSSVVIIFGLGIVIVEWLLRLRERSQWKP